MANVHSKTLRKLTGGLRRAARKKMKFELSRPHLPVTVGTEKRKLIRVQGGNIKQRLLKAEFVVISDGAKTQRVKITDVVEISVLKDQKMVWSTFLKLFNQTIASKSKNNKQHAVKDFTLADFEDF